MNNEQVIELVYPENLHYHYQSLSDLPGFVLLESSDRQKGRYDIVTAYPYERIFIDSNTDLLSKIQSLRTLMPTQFSSLKLPFQGGLIGYLSYDFGAELMGIHSSVFPPLKSMPLLTLGCYDWAIISDHRLRKTFLYKGNQHASTSAYVDHAMALWNQTNTKKEFKLLAPFKTVMSKEHYEHSFYEIRKALKVGRSYQVNFTQPFNAPYKGSSWAMYQQICKQNPVPFSAFLRLDEADILSFSPERFLLLEDNALSTSPIKGTSRRSGTSVEDEQLKAALVSSQKNRAENVMIVDLLRNDLSKVAIPGSVQVTKLCELESYKAVHHLVSTIVAQPQAHSAPIDLFLACFPSGSITGAPKLESMRIINELELFGRGVYCGSIVYFSRHGRFDSNIAIRTLVAKNNMLHLAAGGGIVIDSHCEDEYRECFIKIEAIVNGLQ